MPALCLTKMSKFNETFEGKPYEDDYRAVCVVGRKGLEGEHRAEFSVAQAKKAGLWGKKGPWVSYPDRMLKMRARGFALRDRFADCLGGLISSEEAQDYPTKEKTLETIELQRNGTATHPKDNP